MDSRHREHSGSATSDAAIAAGPRGSADVAQSLMIAFDGGPNSERAIRYAARFLKASTAHVVTAWQPGTLNPARMSSVSAGIQPFVDTSPLEIDVDDALRAEAAEINTRGVELARTAGLDATGTLVEVESTVWGALVAAADALDVDLLVTGTRGDSGLKALLRSSVAGHVLKHSHRPVFIVPASCDKQHPVNP
ncbi:universal stress protein [Gordonia sp. DT30]|uniref:universal stress protein n=1 Tax=unclassified Gordonia (in: high G+C Gram-positive bacteria) TaxID=2657482 RepID=UPI003CEC4815